MTRLVVLRARLNPLRSPLPAIVCVAILVLAAGCGPLGGDDDDEEPTAQAGGTASPVASPHGGSGQAADGTARAGATEAGAENKTQAAGASGTAQPRTTEDAETTQSAGPTPTPTPPTVEGCAEPEELPDVQGRRNRQTKADADEGVNLRSGPGKDCDIVQTLDPGTPVEVRSGPVLADDIVWVQVRVDDTEGWVSEALLEPAQD
jgi:hypothetical protein